MIQTWIRLFTGPNNSNFEEVSMNSEASMGTAILWRTVSIIIASALGYVGSLMGLGNVLGEDGVAKASLATFGVLLGILGTWAWKKR